MQNRLAAGQEVIPDRGAGGRCAPEDHLAGQARDRLCRREQLCIVRIEEVGDGEQQLRSSAVEDVRRFTALEARVHGHDDSAGAVDAQRRDRPLGRVRGPDRNAITGLDPASDERAHQKCTVPGEKLPEGAERSVVSAMTVVVTPAATTTPTPVQYHHVPNTDERAPAPNHNTNEALQPLTAGSG